MILLKYIKQPHFKEVGTLKIEEIYDGWFYPNLLREDRYIRYINPNANPPIFKRLNLLDYKRVFIFDDDRLNPEIYVMTDLEISKITKKSLSKKRADIKSVTPSEDSHESHGRGKTIYETLDAIPIINKGADKFQGRFLLVLNYSEKNMLRLAIRGLIHDDEYCLTKISEWSGTKFAIKNGNISLYNEQSTREYEISAFLKKFKIDVKETLLLLNRMKIYE